MRYLSYPACALSIVFTIALLTAQHLPLPGLANERVLLVVPMTGKGTPEDPRRPLGLPANTVNAATPVGFRYLVADDGKTAIVLLSSPHRAHIDSLLVDAGLVSPHAPTQILSTTSGARIFDPKESDHDSAETALKAFRKDFNLDAFLGNAPFLGGKR